MEDVPETLFDGEPSSWLEGLPAYQKGLVDTLLAGGASYDEAARAWLEASAAGTYLFSASGLPEKKNSFLDNLKKEIQGFICDDKKYSKERAGLFGEKGHAKTFVVSAVSVAIAPHLGIASAVIVPVVALVLASLGKVSVNAWCSTYNAGA
ncbi:hypothetical protein [Burkholderia paludis]|uniref:hypothetical protein n=1 Tax=Burkholderia paludis TaxID=1506587 RepID=UPI000946F419|nr:hypothetical protein [Burkholderia paludis]